jgi:hypothetical protein
LTEGAHGLDLDLLGTRWSDIHRFPRGGRAVIISRTRPGVDPAVSELDYLDLHSARIGIGKVVSSITAE